MNINDYKSMNLCYKRHKVEVLKSANGYYIGTMVDGEPFCRLSEEYFNSYDSAKDALDNRTFTQREFSLEISYCNNSSRKCLV